MPHPLVTQLRFARREFARCFEGVPLGDTRRRLDSLNCLSWIVGHLANQEHFFWVRVGRGKNIVWVLTHNLQLNQIPSSDK